MVSGRDTADAHGENILEIKEIGLVICRCDDGMLEAACPYFADSAGDLSGAGAGTAV
jgi:hypothetical protein